MMDKRPVSFLFGYPAVGFRSPCSLMRTVNQKYLAALLINLLKIK
jgi:hypothetical protein